MIAMATEIANLMKKQSFHLHLLVWVDYNHLGQIFFLLPLQDDVHLHFSLPKTIFYVFRFIKRQVFEIKNCFAVRLQQKIKIYV